MSTQSTSIPVAAPGQAARARATGSASIFLAAATLWQREIVHFYRSIWRMIGVIASPVLFWVVLGSGFGREYMNFLFAGTITLIVLFTAIFSMMSVIEDRKAGFLQSVLVAPVHRSAIVLGKVLGGATLAAIQGLIVVPLGLLIGVQFSVGQVLLIVLIIFLFGFSLTSLGFLIAWPMDSTQGFHAIINMMFIPLWLLSGSVFSTTRSMRWMGWLMRVNPLTYGTETLRWLLFPAGDKPTLPVADSLAIMAAFTCVMFFFAFLAANRRSTKPAA